MNSEKAIDSPTISATEALLWPIIKDVGAMSGRLRQASKGIKASVEDMNAAIEEESVAGI